jgi:hypothetical protein
MKDFLKWPLIIAAILVVLRVVLEQAGTPDRLTNILSVAVLHTLIAPLYFAFLIAASSVRRPYLTLLKSTLVFATVARAMIVPTYWLAYIYQWPQQRFRADQAGVVGEGVTSMQAYVWVPLILSVEWIVVSVLIGGALGSVVIAVKRRRQPQTV